MELSSSTSSSSSCSSSLSSLSPPPISPLPMETCNNYHYSPSTTLTTTFRNYEDESNSNRIHYTNDGDIFNEQAFMRKNKTMQRLYGSGNGDCLNNDNNDSKYNSNYEEKPSTLSTIVKCHIHNDINIKFDNEILKEFNKSTFTFYKYKRTDFFILSDFKIDKYLDYIPKCIKSRLEENWINVYKIEPMLESTISRQLLKRRVRDGKIIAYRYIQLSSNGKDVSYFSFIPKHNVDLTMQHNNFRLNLKGVWPRKIYIILRKHSACTQHTNCCKCLYETRDFIGKGGKRLCKISCIRQIPWNDVYVLLGENDETCVEKIKCTRTCNVCNSCKKCQMSVSYCKRHIKCTHITARKTNIASPNDIRFPGIKGNVKLTNRTYHS